MPGQVQLSHVGQTAHLFFTVIRLLFTSGSRTAIYNFSVRFQTMLR